MKLHLPNPEIPSRFFYFLLTLASFALIITIILSYAPQQYVLLPYVNVSLPVLLGFYASLFLFCLFLLKTVTGHFIHGCSLGILVSSLLLLKTNNFLQLYLVLLLFILIAAIEFSFWPKKRVDKVVAFKNKQPFKIL